MKELPITGDDVENALHSVSENLTEAINRHGQLPEIKERLERLSPKKRFLRADFIRNDFLKIETEILRLKDISKPHYPQRNIFTGEPEGQEEAPLMNFTTHQYALLNYFLSQTRNFIDLLSNMIGNEILCSLESPMKDDSLQSQNESIRTLKETESKIINDSADALDIYDPIKRGTFTTYVKALLHPSDPDNPKRLIILNNSLCFYSNGITKEIKQRRIMIAFADILKDEGIVDKPPQGEDSKDSPAIPYQKYAAAFSFSLDGKIKESFKPKDIQNSATSIDQKIKQLLRKSLIIQV